MFAIDKLQEFNWKRKLPIKIYKKNLRKKVLNGCALIFQKQYLFQSNLGRLIAESSLNNHIIIIERKACLTLETLNKTTKFLISKECTMSYPSTEPLPNQTTKEHYKPSEFRTTIWLQKSTESNRCSENSWQRLKND